MNESTHQSWLSRLKTAVSKKARPASLLAATALAATTLPGCLDRPIGQDGPRTTNILVDLLPQSVVDKIDLLFVIDNSMSMADKQEIMGEAVPELLGRLVTPVCLDANGNQVARAGDGCPVGSSPEFNPIGDINIGIITTSLGGYGTDNCTLLEGRGYTIENVDMAHLVGSLPRATTGPEDSFLRWRAGQNSGDLGDKFRDQILAAGEHGCGFEAPLEAWVRFLVDPYPYTKIVKRPCTGRPEVECIGPELNADGTQQLRDDVIIAQRQEFMRMDSLLAVIMFTDENDCSFKASGQSHLLVRSEPAIKGSSQCAADPNDACCQSCLAPLNAGCQAGEDGKPQGCTAEQFESQDPLDQPNVRCYRQKERFGVDFLYPVERYSNALSMQQICPAADDLHPQSSRCANGGVVDNPVFVRGDEVRPASLVFMGGIVGVPWQDLAQDPTADVLKFRKAVQDDNDPDGRTLINWDWLLGAPINDDGDRALYPNNDGVIDPLMVESIEPRTGTNPAIGEELEPPSAGPNANQINGHEWNIHDRADLQYACIFPRAPETCPTQAEHDALYNAATDDGVPNCDCTLYGGGTAETEANNPLCQDPNTGEYDLTQRYAKAYPSIRPLQALEQFAKVNPASNAIVASICPKETTNKDLDDYGYDPAVATIIDRLKEQLQEPCLPRPLGTKDDDSAACIMIEATTAESGCDLSDGSRLAVENENVAKDVFEALEADGWCGAGTPCSSYNICEIPQVKPDQDEYAACISGSGGNQGNGWCYVDLDKVPDTVNREDVEELLFKCPETQKRKLRFVGRGQPTSNALTFYACSGALFSAADQ